MPVPRTSNVPVVALIGVSLAVGALAGMLARAPSAEATSLMDARLIALQASIATLDHSVKLALTQADTQEGELQRMHEAHIEALRETTEALRAVKTALIPQRPPPTTSVTARSPLHAPM